MEQFTESAWFDRWISPRLLLVAMVASFLGCCLAGQIVRTRNPFESFERFHLFTRPDTLFYPTVNQACALAREKLDPDKIAVLIGGSSFLNGAYQPPDYLWSRKLQDLLGKEYQVLNLGLPGAAPSECGAIVAEALRNDIPRLILVVDTMPGGFVTSPDGHRFRYLFWDARRQGLLERHAEREARLLKAFGDVEAHEKRAGANAARAAFGKTADELREVQRGAWLESWSGARDLWTTIAYRQACTVWTSQTRAHFTWPRRKYPDSEMVSEAAKSAILHPSLLDTVRAVAALAPANLEQGEWNHPVWKELVDSANACFPPATRARTVIVSRWLHSRIVKEVSASERERFTASSRHTCAELRKAGYTAFEAGPGYQADDYLDAAHLSVAGGLKLADQMAPVISELAHRLGFHAGPRADLSRVSKK